MNEFIDVAKRPKFKKYFSPIDLQDLLIRIASRSEFIEVSTMVTRCRDPKDNFLLSLAEDGKASHLLTGDKDLLVLKQHEGTMILTINEYLASSK